MSYIPMGATQAYIPPKVGDNLPVATVYGTATPVAPAPGAPVVADTGSSMGTYLMIGGVLLGAVLLIRHLKHGTHHDHGHHTTSTTTPSEG